MSKTIAKTKDRRRTRRSRKGSVRKDVPRGAPRGEDIEAAHHKLVVENGQTTHVIVPIDEYERLLDAQMVQDAIAHIEDDSTKWVDADEFFLKLAGERIAEARKAKGMTQTQLGKKLGIPQSQISRIERNPDHTTLKTLKRVARALGADVRALI